MASPPFLMWGRDRGRDEVSAASVDESLAMSSKFPVRILGMFYLRGS